MKRLDPEERKNQIIEAAISLSQSQGYATLTCQQIADAAGASRPLVNHYFGDYKMLRAAILQEAVKRRCLDIIIQAMAIKDPALDAPRVLKEQARRQL